MLGDGRNEGLQLDWKLTALKIDTIEIEFEAAFLFWKG